MSETKLVETVTITLKDYNQLLADSDFLQCLYATGVDNWSGYDDAVDLYTEEEED